MRWHFWIVLGLAVWLILAPWVLGFSELNLVTWNHLLVGVMIMIFLLWGQSDVYHTKN